MKAFLRLAALLMTVGGMAADQWVEYEVPFASGKASLGPKADLILDTLKPKIAAGQRVLITGRPDKNGDTNLARLRADALRAILVSKGIPEERITVKTNDEAIPAQDLNTWNQTIAVLQPISNGKPASVPAQINSPVQPLKPSPQNVASSTPKPDGKPELTSAQQPANASKPAQATNATPPKPADVKPIETPAAPIPQGEKSSEGQQRNTSTIQNACRFVIGPEDKTVRAALERWAWAEGWQPVWELNADLPVEVSASLCDKSFEQAVEQIATVYMGSDTPIKAIFYRGNKVLRLMSGAK